MNGYKKNERLFMSVPFGEDVVFISDKQKEAKVPPPPPLFSHPFPPRNPSVRIAL